MLCVYRSLVLASRLYHIIISKSEKAFFPELSLGTHPRQSWTLRSVEFIGLCADYCAAANNLSATVSSLSYDSIWIHFKPGCFLNHVIWRLANWRVRILTSSTVSANDRSPRRCSVTCR